jgi:hypothetical protein
MGRRRTNAKTEAASYKEYALTPIMPPSPTQVPPVEPSAPSIFEGPPPVFEAPPPVFEVPPPPAREPYEHPPAEYHRQVSALAARRGGGLSERHPLTPDPYLQWFSCHMGHEFQALVRDVRDEAYWWCHDCETRLADQAPGLEPIAAVIY